MAGSYRHVTNADGTFDEGMGCVDNLKDAGQTISQMWLMIDHLTGGD